MKGLKDLLIHSLVHDCPEKIPAKNLETILKGVATTPVSLGWKASPVLPRKGGSGNPFDRQVLMEVGQIQF